MDEKKVAELYQWINFLGFDYMYYRKNDYVLKAKRILPEIQEFVEWFMGGNIFGLDDDVYLVLQQNLNAILKDYATGLEENDVVLLLDVLEQGIGEYLKMFLPPDFYEKQKEKIYDATAIAEKFECS